MGPEPAQTKVFLADDDESMRALISSWIRSAGYDCEAFPDGVSLLERAQQEPPDIVCLDVMMPRMDGVEVLRQLKERHPQIPVVMLTAKDLVESAVECMRLGAFDYILKPFDHSRLLDDLAHAAALRHGPVPSEAPPEGIIGESPAMRSLYAQIAKVANSRISVYLRGESGTGKELVARGIHQAGSRSSGPFVPVNCGAIVESLQESELFGHQKGAFTGATSARAGRFEQAEKGTIFLDEVADLNPSAQVGLLRVVQERQVQRIGSDRLLDLDTRLISATHKPLGELVKRGLFREDLYYRIVVYTLDLPPLRERQEDIQPLADHFLAKYAHEVDGRALRLEPAVVKHLEQLRWPGNVRQLENAIYVSMVRCDTESIGLADLPPDLDDDSSSRVSNTDPAPLDPRTEELSVLPIEELERRAITAALDLLDGNVSLAAKKLGIGRATMYRKMEKFGIRADSDGDSKTGS